MTRLQLEKIVRTHSIEAPDYSYRAQKEILDEAVDILSSYKNRTLLPKIVKEKRVHDSTLIETMSDIWMHYINVQYFATSDVNLLNGKSEAGWKSEYFKALAEFVVAEGEIAKINQRWEFGHVDSERIRQLSRNHVVAVLSVEETEWGTFEGTFVDSGQQVGLKAEVVYDNGYSGILLHQCSLREALDSIL